MKTCSITFLFFFICHFIQGQGVGLGTTTPDGSAALDVSSTTRGVLLPRLNQAQRDAIPSPAQGLLLYNITDNCFQVNTGTPSVPDWQCLTTGNASDRWGITGNTGTSDSMHFIGTMDSMSLNFKVNDHHSGQIGFNKTFFGYRAGENSDAENPFNTGIGSYALQSNTTGYYNTGIGASSMIFSQSGVGNTAVGTFTLSNNANGYYNCAIGLQSLFDNTTGSYNVAMGSGSLFSNTTGSYNVALGASALSKNVQGLGNTSTGFSSMFFNISGKLNVANGYQSLYSNTTGNGNTAQGASSLFFNTTGLSNTAIGYDAMAFNTIGSSNVAVGNGALRLNSTASQVVAVGDSALYHSNALGNTALGSRALKSTSSGSSNTGVGSQALYSNTTGGANTATGNLALYSNVDGGANTASGYRTLYGNTSGFNNTAVGGYSLHSNTSGFGNSALGMHALGQNNIGISNTAVGVEALFSNTTGDGNTAIGTSSGASNTSGYGNTFIGASANPGFDSLMNATAIGANALVMVSNALVLGDHLTTSVGIGTPSPSNRLDIALASRTGTHASGRPLYVTGDIQAESNGIEFRHNNGAQGIGFGFNTIYAAGSDASQNLGMSAKGTAGSLIYRTNGAERMRVTADGNIGIGTTTPNAPLTFANVIQNRKIVLWESSNDQHQYYGFGINASVLRYQVSGIVADHVFYAGIDANSSLELVRFKGTGNVGIGTSDVLNRLDVASSVRSGTHAIFRPLYVTGNIGADLNGIEFRHENGTQGIGFGFNTIYATGSNTDQALGLSARGPGGNLFFRTNNFERMTITGTGNVGIGSFAPNAPLQFSNATVNRKIVLYEGANDDHQFFGFGVNIEGILRYQVPVNVNDHVFYAGTSSTTSTELLRIKGSGNVTIQGAIETESFTMPVLLNDFANLGGSYEDVGYYKDKMNRVHLRGSVVQLTNPALILDIFILPAGYRPAGFLTFVAWSDTGPVRIDVGSDGSVKVWAPTAYDFISLSGISFRVP